MARKKKAPARQILLQEKEATARFDENNILNIKYDPDTKLTVVQDIPDNLLSRFILGDSSTGELTPEVKLALLECFQKVAWIDEYGQTYYESLRHALMGDITLDHITAVYTQSGTVYDTDSLDSLKPDLVVTAYYDDSSYQVVTGYVLSGSLEAPSSTITVSYGGKTTTFSVNVTEQIDFTPDSPVIIGGGNFADNVLGYNAASTKRGSFNPLALFNFKYGDTYTISMNGETSIHYALAVYKMPNNADTYDFEVVQGTDKTFSSNVTYISGLDHSWGSGDTTFTWNYDSTHILLPTFRNSSNTTFTSTNVNTTKTKFSITKVTP